MKRYLTVILAIVFLTMTIGCANSEYAVKRTAQGGTIGAGLGYVFGGGAGAKLGAVAGATAGAIVGSIEDEIKPQPVSGASGQQSAPPLFRSREYNRGEQSAYERGRADYERRIQYQREQRAYERGRRGY